VVCPLAGVHTSHASIGQACGLADSLKACAAAAELITQQYRQIEGAEVLPSVLFSTRFTFGIPCQCKKRTADVRVKDSPVNDASWLAGHVRVFRTPKHI
jgi:hypothetical protein